MSPRATYRLNFHRAFTFADGARLAPYLERLGISHVYASPIAAARPGSTHGYDVVDPATVNPEFGGIEGFRAMAASFQARGLGIILDIVPNHMCIAHRANAWWWDVLGKGRASRFAQFFDIDWEPADPALQGKVLLPVLGEPYGEALSGKKIKLVRDGTGGSIIAYFEHRFPIAHEDDARAPRGAYASPEALDALLRRQNFVLDHWRNAGARINWRRFFDINDLAALRMEDDAVFEAVHALPLSLHREGLIEGLRVDHVDGLADPQAYCGKLRARLAQNRRGAATLVVEKILASGERLPHSWNVDGTTGYDFLAQVCALQHDPAGEAPLRSLWQGLSKRSPGFEPEEKLARLETLERFSAQRDAAARAFLRVGEASGRPALETMRNALGRLIANLRISRTYATGDGPADVPEAFEHALARTRHESPARESGALEGVAALMEGRLPSAPARDAVRRFNQLSATIAAKAVEDTAFYRYGVLLSRNEVGSDPDAFSLEPGDFHTLCQRRAQSFPHAMLATATHDHKRGEDARARLAVLSEMPALWEKAVRAWFATTVPARDPIIADGDDYHLFQTLVGAWPLDLALDDADGLSGFCDRILGWRIKSLREAKLKTSWLSIDAAFEDAHAAHIRRLLDPERSSLFLSSLRAFVETIAPAATANTLAQTLLKLTVPGFPDLYQGTELWDLSLVDPDNRRPVDFRTREAALGRAGWVTEFGANWRDGRIKQALIRSLLLQRAADPELFSHGLYLPLATEGPRKDHVVAFARQVEDRFLVVAAARCCMRGLKTDRTVAMDPNWWSNTKIHLPQLAGRPVRDLLNKDGTRTLEPAIPVAHILSSLPVAALVG